MADNSENEKKPDVVEEQSGAQAAGAAEAFRHEVNDTQKDTTSATVSRSIEASLPSSGASLPNLDITMDREGKDRVKDGAASQEKGSETKEPWQIAKDLADAVKNGKPLDEVQKDIGDYIQKMMKAGMSEHEIRTWVGHLGNEVNKASKPESMHIMMSGDGSDGFKVHFIQDALTKNEKELHTFHVPRK